MAAASRPCKDCCTSTEAVRCDECRRAYNREKARRWCSRHRPPTRHCIDCHSVIAVRKGFRVGQTSPRCDSCRLIHKRSKDRSWWARNQSQCRQRARTWRQLNKMKISAHRSTPMKKERTRITRRLWLQKLTQVQRRKRTDSHWMSNIKTRWFNGAPIPDDLRPHLELIREFRKRSKQTPEAT